MQQAIKGGAVAHLSRRAFHVAMLIIPLVYYYFLNAHVSQKVLHLTILAFIFFVFLFEKLRIRMRLVLFAQRFHEATHISAFGWTMLSLGIILFFLPSATFSIPIVATCAIVDPLLGEMRLQNMKKELIISIGVVVALLIWFLCAWIYHFPAWISVIIAPITVAVEWPSLKWIDDNALMLLVPFFIILVLRAAGI
jgi:hypothetical protein